MSPEEKTIMREKIAALEHEQWSQWTRHMLEVLEPLIDYGRKAAIVTGEHGWIDRRAIKAIVACSRWKRQIKTSYDDLSEKEKDSDREWADRVITALGGEE